MATMNTVIERVDKVKPNAFDADIKLGWLSKVEGTISTEVYGMAEPRVPRVPEDADEELMAPEAFDDIYDLYLSAMIDFHNREYEEYNASATLFHERMQALKTWYIQHHTSSRARNFRNVMG